MKISLVSEHASPLALLGSEDAGGQNVHVAALATHLAAAGADVVVHTRRDDRKLARRVPFSERVVVDHVDAGPPEPIHKDALACWMDEFAEDLVRQWRRRRPDIVHAHFWMSGMAAVAAADELAIPVAMTFHALGAEKRLHQGKADTSPYGREAVEGWLARSVDRVVATTGAERRNLLAMGVRPERISVIPCGVDTEHFSPAAQPRHSPMHRLVCVSRLVPRKGIREVIEALARVPGTELLVAGGPRHGDVESDPEVAVLRDVAIRHGVGDRVEFLGAVDRCRIPALMRSADAVCCTPWYEPFGMVALEAMACGVPVVATAVGGLAETVIHNVTGLLVRPRDPSSIAAAIRRLLADEDARATMGAAARQRALGYRWADIASQTSEAYRSMGTRRRPNCGPRPSWIESDESLLERRVG